MENIITIIATEHDGMNTRSLSIDVRVLNESKNFDIKEAVRKAVHEYLCTEEGKETYEYNCECFNWADFEMNVPNEICRKYGFEKVETHVDTIEVDWDEQLMDEEALSEFWGEDEE